MNLVQAPLEHGAFLRVTGFDRSKALLQKPRLRPAGEPVFVLPVVHAFVVAQQKIHVRSVIRQRIFHKLMFFHGMRQTALLPALFLRLVERRKQHVQEHRVVAQGHPAGRAVAPAQIAAQAAVVGFVSLSLLFIEPGKIRRYKAEHIRSCP